MACYIFDQGIDGISSGSVGEVGKQVGIYMWEDGGLDLSKDYPLKAFAQY